MLKKQISTQILFWVLLNSFVFGNVGLNSQVYAAATTTDSYVAKQTLTINRSAGTMISNTDQKPSSELYGLDNSYTKPSGAVVVNVGQLTQSLIDSYPAGTKFWIKAGIHRLSTALVPKDGQEFHGEYGAVISGSKLLTGWVKDGSYNRWYVTGQTQRIPQSNNTDVNPPEAPNAYKSEDIFINNSFRDHVGSINDVSTRGWFFDYANNRIYIGEDPAGKTIEATVSERLFYGGGNNVIFRNLILEKAGSRFSEGAIADDPSTQATPSSGWKIINCEVRLHHGMGIKVGHGSDIYNNFIHHIGQLGVGGNGAVYFHNNELSYNNQHRIDSEWEAGATKWVNANPLVVSHNYSHHNKGPGLWDDYLNGNVTFEYNISEYNERMGILHEVSYNAVIRYNTVRYNGTGTNPYNIEKAGIVVSTSPDTEVYGNVVAYNTGGGIYCGNRPYISWRGPLELKNLYVHNNTIIVNQGAAAGIDDSNNGFAYLPSSNNRFQDNDYYVNLVSGNWFLWVNGLTDWTTWKSYGHDSRGSIHFFDDESSVKKE